MRHPVLTVYPDCRENARYRFLASDAAIAARRAGRYLARAEERYCDGRYSAAAYLVVMARDFGSWARSLGGRLTYEGIPPFDV